jgi:hypothetical protein
VADTLLTAMAAVAAAAAAVQATTAVLSAAAAASLLWWRIAECWLILTDGKDGLLTFTPRAKGSGFNSL